MSHPVQTFPSPLLLPLLGLLGRGRLEQLPGGAALVPLPAAEAEAGQPRPRAAGRRGGCHRRRPRGHRREALDALRAGTAAKERGTEDEKVKIPDNKAKIHDFLWET